jgi:CRP-like cAMP-binding protein
MKTENLQKLLCDSCQVSKASIFKNLDKETLSKNNLFRVTNSYRSGEFVLHQKDPNFGIYCVHSGTLEAIYKRDYGPTIIKEFYPGEIVGLDCLENEFSDFDLVAKTDTLVCFFDKQYFKKLIESNYKLREEFHQQYAV